VNAGWIEIMRWKCRKVIEIQIEAAKNIANATT
jgi:hypothetical protein